MPPFFQSVVHFATVLSSLQPAEMLAGQDALMELWEDLNSPKVPAAVATAVNLFRKKYLPETVAVAK